MLSYNDQFGSELPLPLLFSKTFLSILYRSAYLACSFSLPHAMCAYNFHDCKLWEFLRQAPSKWLQCPGHTPTPSTSGGPPVLSLTLYSLLHQPPPHTLSFLPTTSAPPLCSPQASAALAISRTRSWHVHRVWYPLCISNAQGRLHL